MNDANNAGSLLPCPFCKSRCVTATRDGHGWKIVECDDCGARGPCIDLDGDQYIDRWNALSTPNTPVEQREAIARALMEQFHNPDESWFVPEDEYEASKFLVKCADAILAVRLDEAAIRKDEREKQREIDAKIAEHNDRWGEWSKFVVRQQMVPVTAMQVAIASAIRNGGKQP